MDGSNPLREVKATNVVKFIKQHVIYCYGVSRRIVHENGPQFISTTFPRFCNKFRIQCVSSTVYYPHANGLAEAFNKTITKVLKKFISRSQRDWDVKLGECLWTYRTTVRTSTKATPFSLVYRCETVLPLEIQIPSLVSRRSCAACCSLGAVVKKKCVSKRFGIPSGVIQCA